MNLGKKVPRGPQNTSLMLTCLRCHEFSTRLCFALVIKIFALLRPRSNEVPKVENSGEHTGSSAVFVIKLKSVRPGLCPS